MTAREVREATGTLCVLVGLFVALVAAGWFAVQAALGLWSLLGPLAGAVAVNSTARAATLVVVGLALILLGRRWL